MSDEDDLRDLEDSELKFVPVSIQQLARAVTQVESCEKCNPEAEIPFDWVLRAFADSRYDCKSLTREAGSRCRGPL